MKLYLGVSFTMLSHPGTLRPLQSWSRGPNYRAVGCRPWCHPFGADFGGMKNTSYQALDTSTQISKEGLESKNV